ncbi:MAG: aconitase X swivel domain-containing protein [Thermoplasmatota archaeon]
MDSPFDLSYEGVGLKGMGKEPVKGEVLLWKGPISFLGDVDPDRGILTKDGIQMDIHDKVLIFTEGAGSTVGSYVVYNLRLNNKAPRAMVMLKADAIISIGCILADIPLVHKVPPELWKEASTGDTAVVDSAAGRVGIWKRDGKKQG